MNLPNQLTVSRFAITLLFVVVVLWDTLPYHTSWAALLFMIGGLSDIADGYITPAKARDVYGLTDAQIEAGSA